MKIISPHFSTIFCLATIFILFSGAAHGEGGCPPEMIPAQGTNISSCVPLPARSEHSQDMQQQVGPRWVSQWGAIATDFAHSSAGASVNQPNKASAELAAISECRANGGDRCQIETWYSNGCASLIVGDKTHVSMNAATADEANEEGMALCMKSNDSNCRVYYSSCSLPRRVR